MRHVVQKQWVACATHKIHTKIYEDKPVTTSKHFCTAMWDDRGISDMCAMHLCACTLCAIVYIQYMCNFVCLCVDACMSNHLYASHTYVGWWFVWLWQLLNSQHWLKFHFLPSNKSAISHNHNPQSMTAGEVSSQACSHVLKQELNLKLCLI